MADVEQMLARRTAIAEEMTGLIGRLGVLVREEKELVGVLGSNHRNFRNLGKSVS
jgi:hypothetical protein